MDWISLKDRTPSVEEDGKQIIICKRVKKPAKDSKKYETLAINTDEIDQYNAQETWWRAMNDFDPPTLLFSVNILPLWNETTKLLKEMEIYTLFDLLEKGEKELKKSEKFNKMRIKDIQLALRYEYIDFTKSTPYKLVKAEPTLEERKKRFANSMKNTYVRLAADLILKTREEEKNLKEVLKSYGNLKVEELGLRDRYVESLKNNKILTLRMLIKTPRSKIATFKNMGKLGLAEIENVFTKYKLEFK